MAAQLNELKMRKQFQQGAHQRAAGLSVAIKLAKERERICKNSPLCPECATEQVQIIDAQTQEWKCRHCRHIFFTAL